MQVETAFSVPLEEEWLDASDAGALAEALKTLITELVGWGSQQSYDASIPSAR